MSLPRTLYDLMLISLFSAERVPRGTLPQPQVTDLALRLRTLPPASLSPRRTMQSGDFTLLSLPLVKE